MICIAATLPGVTEVGDYIFRTAITEHYQAFIIAKFAIESLHSTKASAVAFTDDPNALDLVEVFSSQYGRLGGGNTRIEIFPPQPEQWQAQIDAIVEYQPEVMFVPAQLDRIEEILSILRGRGVNAIPLGSFAWLTVDPGRSAFEGSYFVDHYSPYTYEEQSRLFVSNYEQRYGALTDSIPALAYESAALLTNAIGEAESLDSSHIRNALADTDTETLIGRFRFDEIGDPVKPAIINQVKAGAIQYVVSIYPQSVGEEELKEKLSAEITDRESLPMVAVLDLVLSGIPEEEAMIIVDLIGSAMAETGAFRVLERGQRDQMLKELEFSYSDLADARTQIEIGKQLSTNRIITGSLGALADRYILNIKLIDVERGETLSASYQVYRSMNELIDNADRLVVDLVSKTTL
jgi:TolB-like protein